MKTWKDVTQYSTAVASMASGIVLTYLQYFSTHDVSNGVLGYVAQTLMYAAAIFGVTMYWNGKYNEQNLKWNTKFDELKQAVQNGNNINMAVSSQKKAV